MSIPRIVRTPHGFTLIEVALAMAVLSVLAAGVVPVALRQVELRLAQRTGREVSVIQEAAKLFYVENRRWPTSLAELKQGNYLSPAWNAVTAFGDPYIIQASSDGRSFSVTAPVPTGLEGVLEQALVSPTRTPQGTRTRVTSTIAVPGHESSHDMLVHRDGDTMFGDLLIEDNTKIGWQFADGRKRLQMGMADGSGNGVFVVTNPQTGQPHFAVDMQRVFPYGGGGFVGTGSALILQHFPAIGYVMSDGTLAWAQGLAPKEEDPMQPFMVIDEMGAQRIRLNHPTAPAVPSSRAGVNELRGPTIMHDYCCPRGSWLPSAVAYSEAGAIRYIMGMPTGTERFLLVDRFGRSRLDVGMDNTMRFSNGAHEFNGFTRFTGDVVQTSGSTTLRSTTVNGSARVNGAADITGETRIHNGNLLAFQLTGSQDFYISRINRWASEMGSGWSGVLRYASLSDCHEHAVGVDRGIVKWEQRVFRFC